MADHCDSNSGKGGGGGRGGGVVHDLDFVLLDHLDLESCQQMCWTV